MKVKKRKLNLRLFERVKKNILKEPKQFFMDGLFGSIDGLGDFNEDLPSEIPNCGTAACIAGHALFLNSKKKKISEVDDPSTHGKLDEAAELLGIVDYDGNADTSLAEELFLAYRWDKDLFDKYKRFTEQGKWTARAKVAVKAIDRFIKTYNKQPIQEVETESWW